VTVRPLIRVPEPDEWASAQAQFEAGRVTGLPMNIRAGDQVTVAVTQGWLRNWSRPPLTHLERTAIRNVCLQLARGRVHPAVGTRPLELAPTGAWIGSPADGYTITWRPHWSDQQMRARRVTSSMPCKLNWQPLSFSQLRSRSSSPRRGLPTRSLAQDFFAFTPEDGLHLSFRK